MNQYVTKLHRTLLCGLLVIAVLSFGEVSGIYAGSLPSTQSSRQKTIRKLPSSKGGTPKIVLPEYIDTLSCGEHDIVLQGFHKPLRSRRESVFATNNTAHEVVALIIDFTYTDTKGRTLHRQRRTVNTDLPPGETRRLDFPSWDKQQVFYYSYSQEPPRADGTPFDVRCKVDSLIVDSR